MSMNHTTLIDLAARRLADADNAYCGGDSEHYSEATAAAAIAQASRHRPEPLQSAGQSAAGDV